MDESVKRDRRNYSVMKYIVSAADLRDYNKSNFNIDEIKDEEIPFTFSFVAINLTTQ